LQFLPPVFTYEIVKDDIDGILHMFSCYAAIVWDHYAPGIWLGGMCVADDVLR
jgi:hypothetical protein